MASDEPHVMEIDPLEGMHPDNPGFKKILQDTFIRTSPGHDSMGSDWVGAKVLGKGGQGHAGLWVKVDTQTQKVVERIVIKESYLQQHEWTDQEFWFRPYVEPMESYINGLLQHEATNVVKIYHMSVFPTKRAIRQYIEFCELGDLWHDLHYPHMRVNKKLPEAYLWCIFEQLLKAAVTLEHPVGALGPPGQWVVHMDLKADNIFLSLPDSNHFPRYPVAKVGDFGAAKLCRPYENQERKFENIVYTPGYLPPEVWWKHVRPRFTYHDRITIQTDRPELARHVGAAANVWTIGLIMACLLNNHGFPQIINFAEKDKNKWAPGLDATYSKDLRKYIHACMHPDSRSRPEAAYILSRLPKKQEQFAQPMMDQSCMQEGYDGSLDLVGGFRDKLFPIGADAPYKTPAILAEEAKYPSEPDIFYSFVPGVPDEMGVGHDAHPAAGPAYSFVADEPDRVIPRKPVPAPKSLSPPKMDLLRLGTDVKSVGGAMKDAMDDPMVEPAAAPPEAPATDDPIAEAMAAAEGDALPISADSLGYLRTWYDLNP